MIIFQEAAAGGTSKVQIPDSHPEVLPASHPAKPLHALPSAEVPQKVHLVPVPPRREAAAVRKRENHPPPDPRSGKSRKLFLLSSKKRETSGIFVFAGLFADQGIVIQKHHVIFVRTESVRFGAGNKDFLKRKQTERRRQQTGLAVDLGK